MQLFLSSALLFSLLPLTAYGQTLCQKYSIALFASTTADDELALIEAVVNLATLGDETMGVPGILAADGGLLNRFSGAGPTTNRGGTAVTVNFLDGASGLPDNLDPNSNTAFLLNHLYQFFGALLGCTADGFPQYAGIPDMYEVHKFMNINKTENDYFISQVGAAASALGVTDEDVTTIATVLDTIFNYRCYPPLTADDGVPDFMVGTDPSICQAMDCPVKDESACKDDDGMMSNKPTPAPGVKPSSAPVSVPTTDNSSGGSRVAFRSTFAMVGLMVMVLVVG